MLVCTIGLGVVLNMWSIGMKTACEFLLISCGISFDKVRGEYCKFGSQSDRLCVDCMLLSVGYLIFFIIEMDVFSLEDEEYQSMFITQSDNKSVMDDCMPVNEGNILDLDKESYRQGEAECCVQPMYEDISDVMISIFPVHRLMAVMIGQ